jgi:hypothetical protein
LEFGFACAACRCDALVGYFFSFPDDLLVDDWLAGENAIGFDGPQPRTAGRQIKVASAVEELQTGCVLLFRIVGYEQDEASDARFGFKREGFR